MAHIGKQWKLQFRRDLARVASNQQAYPEAYLLGGIGGAGSIGSKMPVDPWLCVNLLTNDQPPMVWTADSQIVNGVPVHVVLEISDPFIISESTMHVTVYKLGSTMIYRQSITLNPLSGPQPGLWFGIGGTVEFQTPEFNSPGGAFSTAGHAATWASYNP